MGLTLPVPWSNDQQLRALTKQKEVSPNPFIRLRSLLVLLEPGVRANLADFNAFALCVEYLERMFWREEIIVFTRLQGKPDREATDLLIQNIAVRDQALESALSEDWNRGRFADSEAASEPVFGLEPKDQLLFAWRQASSYTSSLARDPARFYRLLWAE